MHLYKHAPAQMFTGPSSHLLEHDWAVSPQVSSPTRRDRRACTAGVRPPDVQLRTAGTPARAAAPATSADAAGGAAAPPSC